MYHLFLSVRTLHLTTSLWHPQRTLHLTTSLWHQQRTLHLTTELMAPTEDTASHYRAYGTDRGSLHLTADPITLFNEKHSKTSRSHGAAHLIIYKKICQLTTITYYCLNIFIYVYRYFFETCNEGQASLIGWMGNNLSKECSIY